MASDNYNMDFVGKNLMIWHYQTNVWFTFQDKIERVKSMQWLLIQRNKSLQQQIDIKDKQLFRRLDNDML